MRKLIIFLSIFGLVLAFGDAEESSQDGVIQLLHNAAQALKSTQSEASIQTALILENMQKEDESNQSLSVERTNVQKEDESNQSLSSERTKQLKEGRPLVRKEHLLNGLKSVLTVNCKLLKHISLLHSENGYLGVAQLFSALLNTILDKSQICFVAHSLTQENAEVHSKDLQRSRTSSLSVAKQTLVKSLANAYSRLNSLIQRINEIRANKDGYLSSIQMLSLIFRISADAGREESRSGASPGGEPLNGIITDTLERMVQTANNLFKNVESLSENISDSIRMKFHFIQSTLDFGYQFYKCVQNQLSRESKHPIFNTIGNIYNCVKTSIDGVTSYKILDASSSGNELLLH